MVGGSTSAAAFSVSRHCGTFYVVAFDRYGRPIHGHPLANLVFDDPRCALAAIEGFASASAPSLSFVCPSDDAAQ